jgi:hypothetical protein
MKGLFLSLLVFIFYVLSSVLLSQILKPKRHAKLFLPLAIIAFPLFLMMYAATPTNLWFLSLGWQATHVWLDVMLGMMILFFNIHSYVDWFFGFNGGFSTSLMLLLLNKGSHGTTREELMTHYNSSAGSKIHAWRLPRLEETGYLRIDAKTDLCHLTKKGILIATLARQAKKILSLGTGG